MLAQRMFDLQSTGRSVGPHRYELVDNKEKFQVSLDVPGVKMEDIDVSIQDGFITISGQRVVNTETSRSSSKFSQSFSLDPTVDIEHFTATLNNGVLIVSAPKDVKKLEENVRRIPITAAAANDQLPATESFPAIDTKAADASKEIPQMAEEPEVETVDLDKN